MEKRPKRKYRIVRAIHEYKRNDQNIFRGKEFQEQPKTREEVFELLKEEAQRKTIF